MNKFNTPKFKAQATLTIAIYFIMLCLAFLSATALMASYEAEKVKWDSENQCIAEWVAMGFERAELKRDNGSCYYHPINKSGE